MLVPLMNATFMRRLTPWPGPFTTRKLSAPALLAAVVGLTGCATPGPLHIYSVAPQAERPITDTGPGQAASTPSYLKREDRVAGFAYDPYTDHFFVRLEPGHHIRVVDRPARKIKREFDIAGAEVKTAGDLTARPRDGHLFLLGTPAGTVVETSRFGKVIRSFQLQDVTGTPSGLACDPVRNHLLVLASDGRRVTRHELDGRRLGELALAETAIASLAYDAEARELFAPLRDRPGEIGVFDEQGRLLRTERAPGRLIDVGPRSFLRVF